MKKSLITAALIAVFAAPIALMPSDCDAAPKKPSFTQEDIKRNSVEAKQRAYDKMNQPNRELFYQEKQRNSRTPPYHKYKTASAHHWLNEFDDDDIDAALDKIFANELQENAAENNTPPPTDMPITNKTDYLLKYRFVPSEARASGDTLYVPVSDNKEKIVQIQKYEKTDSKGRVIFEVRLFQTTSANIAPYSKYYLIIERVKYSDGDASYVTYGSPERGDFVIAEEDTAMMTSLLRP